MTTVPVLLPRSMHRACACKASLSQKGEQITAVRVNVLVNVEPRKPQMPVRVPDGLECKLLPSGDSGHVLPVEPYQ